MSAALCALRVYHLSLRSALHALIEKKVFPLGQKKEIATVHPQGCFFNSLSSGKRKTRVSKTQSGKISKGYKELCYGKVSRVLHELCRCEAMIK